MPIAPRFNGPEHWRQRAEEARILAEPMSDERNKQDAQDRGRLRQAHRQSLGAHYRRDEGELIGASAWIL
jgi:hypothetical protein